MEEKQLNAVMDACRECFKQSQLSLDELGLRMGYEGDSARKSAWQFLNKTTDPRLSMLFKFAGAIGVEPSQLLKKAKP